TLEKVCGRKGLLPDTYYLSAGSLTKVSTFPKSCGGFADVYNGQYDGRSVALKALRVYGKEQIRKTTKRFCKEAIYWKRLSHANIVPFLGVTDAKMFPLCMVSSWMPHGNLAAYLKNKPTSNRIDLLLDVVKGLDYLHEQGVVHGDLKSANILIDDSYRARLADFGLATLNSPSCSTTSKSLCGSVRWMAPELLYPERTGRDSSRVSVMSDVYALAMVILEIFSDNVPFHDKSEAGVVIAITLGIKPEHPGADAVALGLTSDIWELMERCWQIDWRRRPSLREILSCIEKKRLSFPSDVLPSEIETAELINHEFHCSERLSLLYLHICSDHLDHHRHRNAMWAEKPARLFVAIRRVDAFWNSYGDPSFPHRI
ncbi:kinase-like domain-containing protein, partial [Phellopilus nigrolimitatus]